MSVFWSVNSHMQVSLRSLVTKLIDGSFVPWMVWRNTCLSNTTFCLGLKWLFKAPLHPCISYQHLLNTWKCPVHLALRSGVVITLICELLSIPDAVKQNSTFCFHFFGRWAKSVVTKLKKVPDGQSILLRQIKKIQTAMKVLNYWFIKWAYLTVLLTHWV